MEPPLIELTAAHDLTQLQLELYVLAEELILWAASNRVAKDLPRGGHIALPHLQMGRVDPDLCKREARMRDHLAAFGEHEPRACRIACGELLKHSVSEPQVNITAP